jgi:hypothetical protein
MEEERPEIVKLVPPLIVPRLGKTVTDVLLKALEEWSSMYEKLRKFSLRSRPLLDK